METTITKNTTYKQLQQMCPKGLFKNQPREILISLLLKTGKVADKSSVSAVKLADKKFIADAIKSTHQKTIEKKKSSAKTKSFKIRSLADKGKTVLQIAKLMSDTHYSFIYSVVKKHLHASKR